MNRDAFRLLATAGQIQPALAERLQHMVGFRNIAVHQYQAMNNTIVARIVEDHLGDFTDFLDALKPG
jgi:uncharacterized protein YutE (UPF0331/DUF86 family)